MMKKTSYSAHQEIMWHAYIDTNDVHALTLICSDERDHGPQHEVQRNQ